MCNLFYRNPRLLILTIGIILVAGFSSCQVLPRLEDPLLIERSAVINTALPGADAERVESLVTEKLEEALRDIKEIKRLRSSSRLGASTIAILLRDDVHDVDTVWSRVRDKLADVRGELPPQTLEPDFDQLKVRAYALIAALQWTASTTPNYGILRRLAEDLNQEIKAIPGSEEVNVFGDPDEEILVEVRPQALASLGLTTAQLSQQVKASDAKVAAGQLRSERGDLILEVDGQLDSLARIGRTPIRYGEHGHIVALSDIATLTKTTADPPSSLALINGHAAVVLGILVRPDYRIDRWTNRVKRVLAQFSERLPRGIELSQVLEQNRYVQSRLGGLVMNLILGGLAVIGVVLLMMGWRSSLIVGAALPLSVLMVLAAMRVLGIPIHQMSVTGLIIALGLLIDNAIVIVDDVREKISRGLPAGDAVAHGVRHLAVPLLGSTLTTALAFAPIALMTGPAGEFVGSVALTVMLAIASSFFLAMTVVPALTGLSVRQSTEPAPRYALRAEGRTGVRQKFARIGLASMRLWSRGFSHAALTKLYRNSLDGMFHRPLVGIILGLALPLFGFVQSRHLPEQFFPPADRDQIQIELELSAHASMSETLHTVKRVHAHIRRHDHVESDAWFLGESAPTFYYNVIRRRQNMPRYAQALVQLRSAERSPQVIQELQATLNAAFPQARVLVRQLEQGPPYDAPVELRLYGPDLARLRELGDQLRAVLATTPNVIQTRAELSEALPKLSVTIDEEKARLLGLDHAAIARQLNTTLEGAVGGSVHEAAEELRVRVRTSNEQRAKLDHIASLDLLSALPGQLAPAADYPGIPLTAVAQIALEPELAAIPHFNGRRMNEVQAFLTAGTLPANVVAEFQARLAKGDFRLPPGYLFEFGGEAAEREEAVGNLMANVSVLVVLMLTTLVLSFRSFRSALLIGFVGALSMGLGFGALSLSPHSFGFMAIVGTMGLVGIAINDAIVVLAALREDPQARQGKPAGVREVVVRSTRHIVATSLTTIAGFTPLVLAGGGFWPPVAVSIAGGVAGATILALYFVPSAYILMTYRAAGKSDDAPTIVYPVDVAIRKKNSLAI